MVMTLDFEISTGTNPSFSLDTAGVSRAMPACVDGNYYEKNTIIPLTVKLSNYKFLYFICGKDSLSEGVQTIIIPLHTGQSYYRLTWDILDGVLRPISKLFQCLIISIDERQNKVTIRNSNVTDYGIRKILAG